MNANIGRESFVDLSRGGDVLPIRYKIDSNIEPLEAYDLMRDYEDTGHSFLLESAVRSSINSDDRETDRYSFVGFDPLARVEVGPNRAEIQSLRGDNHTIDFDDAVEDDEIIDGCDGLDAMRDAMPDIDFNLLDGGKSFEGGFVGFHPYDIVYDVKPLENNREGVRPSVFVCADRYFVFDHEKDDLELVFTPIEDRNSGELYDDIEDEAEDVIAHLLEEEQSISDTVEVLERNEGARHKYEEKVEEVKDYIERGDIYQAVISRKKEFEVEGDPLTVYRELRRENASPYMYYMEFDGEGVMGASPETLARVDGNEIETRPLAGTRPRGESLDDDRELEGDLLRDRKERAEHSMLVDLSRNDVFRVARPGTLSVDYYMRTLKLENLQHLETGMSAELSSENDRFDAVRSLIPLGTLSGAPKIRAMELISEMEEDSREIYGGAAGYYSFTGDMDFAIAIRSMMFQKQHERFSADFQAGAGIVADSDPRKEFEETELKMSALDQSMESAQGGIE